MPHCELKWEIPVIDRVSVRRGSCIGAGSVVTKDIPDNVLAIGLPAKAVRELTESDWTELV